MKGPDNPDEWDVLYHFTSMKTIYEIVTKGKFKLFDITKSNDPLEGRFVLDSLEEARVKMCNGGIISSEEATFLRNTFWDFNEKITTTNRNSILVLASSFCAPIHELLLWRSYGDGGKGVALGFDKNKLQQIQKDNKGFRFEKVSYLAKEEMIDNYIVFWTEFLKKHNHQEKYVFTAGMLTDLFQEYIDGFFKKELSNSDECEYRLINCFISLDNYLLPGFGEKVKGYDFFVSEDDLKLFYTIDITEKNKERGIITDVVLGPINKVSNSEMHFVLCQHEMSHCNVYKADWISMR